MQIKKRKSDFVGAEKVPVKGFEGAKKVPSTDVEGAKVIRGADLGVKANLAALKKGAKAPEADMVPRDSEPSGKDISSFPAQTEYRERIKKRLK